MTKDQRNVSNNSKLKQMIYSISYMSVVFPVPTARKKNDNHY
jgi:hypothetical protein